MQLNKNIKIFINYFLGPILFTWLVFSIYTQIKNQPNIEASWLHIKASFQSYKISYLFLAFILVFFNWGIEAKKWQLSVLPVYPVSFIQSFKAILAGVSFSVTTPNRVGEYLGRMLYVPDGSRLKTIAVTLVGSLSQLLITLICGIAGLIFLKNKLIEADIISIVWYQFALFGIAFFTLILLLIYFGVHSIALWFIKIFKRTNYLYLIESLKAFDTSLLIKLLLLSFIRYIVFIVQYFLLFSLFDVHVSPWIVWCVLNVVFLAMAIIPSIALVEVGVRGEISLTLMGLYTLNSLGIGLTSITIWIINLIMPALVGSILILSVKVFKKSNEIKSK